MTDVSDPTSPVAIGAINTPGQAWGVAPASNHAYVVDRMPGFRVVDVTSPASPALLGRAHRQR